MKFKTAMICACAVMLLALPVAAGEDEGGFFVGLEATFLQPSGGDLDYVIDDPVDDGYPQGMVRAVDFDAEITPRLILGWGDKHGGNWFVTWWNYDEDTTHSLANQEGGELWDMLFHVDFSADYYQGNAEATSSMDAEVIDFGYSRPAFKSDRFFGHWTVGLRQASLDRSLGVLYDYVDLGYTGHVMLDSEMDGLGLMGGLKGTFKLADSWFLSGGMSYALMQGDLDNSTFMYFDDDPLDFVGDIERDTDSSFSTFDANLALVWQAADALYVWGGYEFSQWSNAVGTTLFPDDVHPGFLQTDVSDVTFDGFKIGVGYKF